MSGDEWQPDMSSKTVYSSEKNLRLMIPRGDWFRYAAIIGIFSCVMIGVSLLTPWYRADYVINSTFEYQEEFFTGIGDQYSQASEGMGSLMTKVTVVVVLSLVAAVIATLLSYLRNRVLGVVAAVFSTGFLALGVVVFFRGVIEELSLSSFEGFSHINRTVAVTTAPMLGWWIAVLGVFVLVAQTIILVLSHGPERVKEEPLRASEEGLDK